MSKERRVSFVDRLVQQAMGKGQRVGSEDDPAKEKYPVLWEWMETIYVGAEKLKQPPQITISLSPDGCLVRVTDRDLSRSVEITCAHLEQVFQALEENLNSPKPAIRILGKKEPKLRTRQNLNGR